MTRGQVTGGQDVSGPLAGLRVIDLGQVVAAPIAASLFADFGADVIKIEHPQRGDPIRKLARSKHGVGLWWKVSARNKRTIALDLGDAEDLDVFHSLVEQADVVLENFAPGVMERLGIGYDTLQERNPRLIQLSISGFGQTGPRRALKAFGRSAEAYSGMAYTNGYPDRPPVHMAFPVADCLSGVLGAFAVMMAVHERAQSGRGQYIDLALFEAVFRLQEYIPIHYDQLGLVTEREGTSNSYTAPVNTWSTADGKLISFTGSTQGMVERLFHAMERPDLIDDPRFVDNAARVRHREALDAIIGNWMATLTLAEVQERFDANEVAASPILNIADIFDDAHYWERGALVEVEDPDLGRVRIQGVAPRMSRTPGAIRWLGRGVDADRHTILHDWLGRDPDTDARTDEPGSRLREEPTP